MKRDLNQPMLDLEGKPFEDVKTLRDIVYAALRATLPGDERLTPLESNEVFALAIRVVQGGVIDVTAKELQTLTDRVGRIFPNPIVRGLATRMLENDFVDPPA